MEKPEHARGHGVTLREIETVANDDEINDSQYLRFLLRFAIEKLRVLKQLNAETQEIVDREEWLEK